MAVYTIPAPPNLPTFDLKPSWHNRAGRTDRSACAEIRASNLWKFICSSAEAGSDESSRKTRMYFHLNARYLSQLQNKFPGRTLAGDERTTKSNAMRPRNHRNPRNLNSKHQRFPKVCNPNKGAAREKFLGLWENWSQTIIIVRKYQHARLSQHFLICPGCQQRALKLFLPFCTRIESHDADAAELWINSIDHYYLTVRRPMPAETMQLRAALINRFGILFREGRVLKCRKCYGIRYGEKRE